MEGAITVSTVWQVSNTVAGGCSWLAKANGPFLLAAEHAGKYIRSSSTGTDSLDRFANAKSTGDGHVEGEAQSSDDATVTGTR